MALDLVIALLLVLANGFFVATEFAVARLRPTQVEELAREGKPGARSVRHAVEHIDAYLAACQLGITLASIGLGVVGKPAFEELLEPILGDAASIGGFGVAAALAFAIITLLHVVVGELSPKSVAISRTVPTSLVVGPPMRAFYIATKPLVDSFNGLGNLLIKPFGIPPAREAAHTAHSEDELRMIMRESRKGGLIEEGDHVLTENVFAFGDARVREIMTPRGEIDYLTTDDDVRRAIDLAIETGHTRLPLGEPEKGLDEPIALIHAKDLLPAMARQDDRPLTELARPITRVSEAALLSEVLPELRLRHLALAVDEHGTTIGLVTLEDVIEELVGEIEDEFDLHEETEVRRDGDAWIVPGSLGIRDLARELGMDIDDSHEATIGGYVVEGLGRVPEGGEGVEVGGLRVEVVESDGPLLKTLRVRPAPEDEPED